MADAIGAIIGFVWWLIIILAVTKWALGVLF